MAGEGGEGVDRALHSLLAASDWLYLWLNGLSGRSWVFDSLVALAIDNNLVKAGPVAAAFLFAWQAGDGARRVRGRRVLLATIASLLLVLAASKAVADSIFLPRPFIHSGEVYHIEGGRLVETPRLAFRQPQAGFSHGRQERLRAGEIDSNDLASFPSDHAAFFFALALGILLAHRGAGLLAVGWTLVAICGSRMVSGTHSPLDIAAGLGLGGGILLLFQLAATRWAARPFDSAARWTTRHPAASSAGLFLILFEAANTLENVREVLRTARAIAQRTLGL